MSNCHVERGYTLRAMSDGLTALLENNYPSYYLQEIVNALLHDGEEHVDVPHSDVQCIALAMRHSSCTNVSTLRDADEFECSGCGQGLNIGKQLSDWESISFCPFCGAEIVE